MKDYHVFSSENLTDWEDHGVIISQESVPWVDSTSYSMWAPDCICKNGKYYFYFPAIARDKSDRRGMRIGVAISDTPYGPFEPESQPIDGVFGVDPNIFIDKDGSAYLFWAGMQRLFGAELKDNMIELDSEPREIEGLPGKFKEGPFLFERNGIYYLTFPYVPETTEQLVYAIGDRPMGPFRIMGVIMDESPTGCWTNHQSILEYKGQWILFYHHNDLSPSFDKNRSIRADSLFFSEDGTIQKVIPTWRGVGLTPASRMIQIDRISAASEGLSIAFLDTLDTQAGWKISFSTEGAWARYNSVDFGDHEYRSVHVNALSGIGGVIEIRIGGADGTAIARICIVKNRSWNIVDSALLEVPSGIQDVVVIACEGSAEIDWVRFK
jgi:hypothetical protein